MATCTHRYGYALWAETRSAGAFPLVKWTTQRGATHVRNQIRFLRRVNRNVSAEGPRAITKCWIVVGRWTAEDGWRFRRLDVEIPLVEVSTYRPTLALVP